MDIPIDDGSGKPEGMLSSDGHLVIKGGEWVETELGQVERWRNQAPDLYEAFMRQTEELVAPRRHGGENVANELVGVLCDVAQVFDGWHADGTAWTEWDESVRRRVSSLLDILTQGAQPSPREQVLEEALKKLRDCDWTIGRGDRMDAVRDLAREALAASPAVSPSPWRTMESIPDRKRVLLWCPKRTFPEMIGISIDGRVMESSSGWGSISATHWRPLPDGPLTLSEADK